MRPIVATGRVVGLDVARAVALVGMIATHVLPGTDEGGVTLVQQLAGGRASALFAVLAGASLALMSGRANPLRGRERAAASAGLAVRALLIAAVGLLLGALDSGIAVILTNYGLLFLLGIPFLGLRARWLAVLSGAWLVVVPVLSHLLRPHLPARSYDSPQPASFEDPAQLLGELLFTGYYPVVPWLAYLLAGMAIGRLDLSRTRPAAGLLGLGAVVAAASWFLSTALVSRPGVLSTLRETYDGVARGANLGEILDHGLYGSTPTGSWWWLAVRAPHSGTPFDLAHTIGSALVVIGLCVLVACLLPRTMTVLFGAGAMTLTLYSLHVCLRTVDAWAGDDPGTFVRHVVLVGLIGAVFRVVRRRGPLEAVVAFVARETKQALRPSTSPSAPR